jgi:hypothetical protein
MLQSIGGAPAGEPSVKVYSCVLVRNREDRPRYVVLVVYEDGKDGRVHPIRREYQWVRGEGPNEWMWVCIRVSELHYKAIVPQQPHIEMREQWVAHVKVQGAKARVGVP